MDFYIFLVLIDVNVIVQSECTLRCHVNLFGELLKHAISGS